MSNVWKAQVDRALREGEVAGLYFTTALLIAVEFSFVYWLHRIPARGAARSASAAFIPMPPWYEEPRFEVSLLLTVLAGLLFTLCWKLWELWRRKSNPGAWQASVASVKHRIRTTMSVAALTGVNLALATWLLG